MGSWFEEMEEKMLDSSIVIGRNYFVIAYCSVHGRRLVKRIEP